MSLKLIFSMTCVRKRFSMSESVMTSVFNAREVVISWKHGWRSHFLSSNMPLLLAWKAGASFSSCPSSSFLLGFIVWLGVWFQNEKGLVSNPCST